MTENEKLEIIEKIKKTHDNIVVTTGIAIGIILGVYFFTFAMFLDSASSILLWFEIISAILFVLILVFIRRVGFFLTKLLLGGKAKYKSVFATLSISDLALDKDVLITKISGPD